MDRGWDASLPVLLVEDNADVRAGMVEWLQAEGFRVVAAENGRDALAQLRAGLKPALIVLDLMMPVMDGIEFREEQLNDAALADIPVVICSARYDVDSCATRLSAVGSFRKGSDPETLIRLIRAQYEDAADAQEPELRASVLAA